MRVSTTVAELPAPSSTSTAVLDVFADEPGWATSTTWIGVSIWAPSAMRITTPSVPYATLSAT